MPQLIRALGAWKNPHFNEVLKDEIRQLGMAALPLQQGLSRSSHVSGDKYDVVVLNVAEEPQRILVKAGIFYQDEQTEYCVLQFDIDKRSAEAAISLLED